MPASAASARLLPPAPAASMAIAIASSFWVCAALVSFALRPDSRSRGPVKCSVGTGACYRTRHAPPCIAYMRASRTACACPSPWTACASFCSLSSDLQRVLFFCFFVTTKVCVNQKAKFFLKIDPISALCVFFAGGEFVICCVGGELAICCVGVN